MKNQNNKDLISKPSKWSILLGILQFFLAILLDLVVYVFFMIYGGEFLIITEGSWILMTFAVLLIGGTVYSTIMAIISVKKGRWWGCLLEKIESKTYKSAWLLFWSIWNIIPAILLIIVIRFLWPIVEFSFPLILLIILSTPFIVYAILFIIGSIEVFLEKLRFLKEVRIMHSLEAAGIAFLFVFSSFGLFIATWNPQWTDGVQRQEIFVPGDQEGREYRIPAMVVLPGDIILAFCESRECAMLDWGDIDIVMRRSVDGGKTWGPIRVMKDSGELSVWAPCPLYDKDTQMVWLYFSDQTMYIMNSSDFGATWSEPRNLTQEMGLMGKGGGAGPGNGIQMLNGRLVIPAYLGGACVIYSDDHGITWKKGGNIGEDEEPQVEEPQVFESVNGSLCIICRVGRGGYKLMAWSHDGGETWDPYYYNEDLTEAGTQASIHRFTKNTTHMRNRVLFSNPACFSRGHFTIRMSYDEGKTWNVSKMVYEGPSAYSSIAILSDYTICVLFETGKYDYRQSITFIKVDLNLLTDGQDQLVPKT